MPQNHQNYFTVDRLHFPLPAFMPFNFFPSHPSSSIPDIISCNRRAKNGIVFVFQPNQWVTNNAGKMNHWYREYFLSKIEKNAGNEKTIGIGGRGSTLNLVQG